MLCARTFEEAKQALSAEQFALAVLGVYFAESRMFDLLALARGSASNRDTPIVCVLGLRGLSDLLIRSLEQTINSMPRTAFLNLAAIPDDANGNVFVRSFLDRYLPKVGLVNLGVLRELGRAS